MMETLRASVQYGDFRGEAAADTHLGTGLNELARKLKLPGFPVGLSFYSGEHGYQSIAVYTVPCGSFDEVEQLAIENDGVITANRHVVENMRIDDLLKIFKRFDITLRGGKFKHVSEIEFE